MVLRGLRRAYAADTSSRCGIRGCAWGFGFVATQILAVSLPILLGWALNKLGIIGGDLDNRLPTLVLNVALAVFDPRLYRWGGGPARRRHARPPYARDRCHLCHRDRGRARDGVSAARHRGCPRLVSVCHRLRQLRFYRASGGGRNSGCRSGALCGHLPHSRQRHPVCGGPSLLHRRHGRCGPSRRSPARRARLAQDPHARRKAWRCSCLRSQA